MIDFNCRDSDLYVFQNEFRDRIPGKIIDAHVHIWEKKCLGIPESEYEIYRQYKPWTDFIYNEQFNLEDYIKYTSSLFPGISVTGMYFGLPFEKVIVEETNAYVLDAAERSDIAFYYIPTQFEDIYETEKSLHLLDRKGFIGFKPYPDLVKGKHGECSIYDMLNRSVLEFSDKHNLTVMLHIPKKAKLRDKQNCSELKQIVTNYPNIRFILAHVARAFVYYDAENLIDFLTDYDNVWFDTACVNDPIVLEYLLKRTDSSKVIYGSDAPVAYYRGRDVMLNNKHYFVSDKLFPWGFGPVNSEIADITFIIYEEIRAALHAIKAVYGREEEKHIERYFYSNSKQILNERSLMI